MGTVSALKKCRTWDECVTAIDDGFVAVGQALFDIRENSLWAAAGYESFEEAVKSKWGMSKAYANRLIAACGVVKAIHELGRPGAEPQGERQVRPLTSLETEEDIGLAWESAVDYATEQGKEKPTMEDVRLAAEAVKSTKSIVQVKRLEERRKQVWLVLHGIRNINEMAYSPDRYVRELKRSPSYEQINGIRQARQVLADIIKELKTDERLKKLAD